MSIVGVVLEMLILACINIVGLVIGIMVLVGLWKVFVKAGHPGWYAFIPFYNVYVIITKIVGLPIQWCYYLLILYIISIPQQLSAMALVPLIDLPELALVVSLGMSVLSFFVVRLLLRAYGQSDGIGITIIMLFLPFWLLYRIGIKPAIYGGIPSHAGIPQLPWFVRTLLPPTE